jgi:hypothetical protein
MPQSSSRNANGERLVLHPRPRAALVKLETQEPLTEGAPRIERYSTAHKVIFEKHIFPTGKVPWYKVKP